MAPRAKSLKTAHPNRGLSPGQPLVIAARELLQPRFERLNEVLAEALVAPAEEAEPIHRLRVATRRCATALNTFGRLIPSELRQPVQRRLKRLRQACGPARDLDIQRDFYEHLLTEVETRDLAVVDLLYERVANRRERLQQELQQSLGRGRKKLQRRMDDVLDHLEILQERPTAPFGRVAQTAGPLLSRALNDVCSRGPNADSTAESLHSLRIAGKHLRYACELFEPLLGDDFADSLAPHLVALQDELGICHDSQVTREELARLRLRWKRKRHGAKWDQKPQGLFLWKELVGGLRFVARVHADRAEQARDRFLTLWPSFSTTAFRQPLESRLQQLTQSSLLRTPDSSGACTR